MSLCLCAYAFGLKFLNRHEDFMHLDLRMALCWPDNLDTTKTNIDMEYTCQSFFFFVRVFQRISDLTLMSILIFDSDNVYGIK